MSKITKDGTIWNSANPPAEIGTLDVVEGEDAIVVTMNETETGALWHSDGTYWVSNGPADQLGRFSFWCVLPSGDGGCNRWEWKYQYRVNVNSPWMDVAGPNNRGVVVPF